MTYSESLDNLYTLLETVCNNYQYEVIVEAANDADANDKVSADKGKVAKFANASVIIMKKIWETIINFIRQMRMKIAQLVDKVSKTDKTVLNGPIRIGGNEITISTGAYKIDKALYNEVYSAIGSGLNSIDKDEDLVRRLEFAVNNTATVSANSTFHYGYREMKAYMNAIESLAVKASKSVTKFAEKAATDGAEYVNSKKAVVQAFNRYVQVVCGDFRTIIANASYTTNKQDSKDNKELLKRKSSLEKTFSKVNAESVEFDGDINALRANLLIEAAQLLKEETEVQDNIEDIPDEDPVVDDEYPDDASGGDEYPEDHLDDVKDLVDDDKKALDILTKDDDSMTISESINLDFDF